MAKFGPTPIPARDRFARYVVKRDDGCWIWAGAKAGDYGKFHDGKRNNRLAHRFAYSEFVGEIPDGMVVMHACDNPLCVSPDHLRLGTHQDNMRDKAMKRRARHGEKHPLARVTDDAVRAIRAAYASGNFTQRRLAEMHGISQIGVSKIVRRLTWSHVP